MCSGRLDLHIKFMDMGDGSANRSQDVPVHPPQTKFLQADRGFITSRWEPRGVIFQLGFLRGLLLSLS